MQPDMEAIESGLNDLTDVLSFYKVTSLDLAQLVEKDHEEFRERRPRYCTRG